MRALTRRRLAAPVMTAVLFAFAAGCGDAAARTTGAGNSGLATRTAKSGPVNVSVTPITIDGTGARFAVELNNHEVDLKGDYATRSTLTVGRTAWSNPRWNGDGPGGHHRSGTLTFSAGGQAEGAVQLRLVGLPSPVTVHWNLQAVK